MTDLNHIKDIGEDGGHDLEAVTINTARMWFHCKDCDVCWMRESEYKDAECEPREVTDR